MRGMDRSGRRFGEGVWIMVEGIREWGIYVYGGYGG